MVYLFPENFLPKGDNKKSVITLSLIIMFIIGSFLIYKIFLPKKQRIKNEGSNTVDIRVYQYFYIDAVFTPLMLKYPVVGTTADFITKTISD